MTTLRAVPFATWAAVGILTLTVLGPAQAQQVYRIVGPDGKVSFSDQAPETLAPGSRASKKVPVTTGASANSLPYALREVAQRFPVILYTGDNCGPCGAARNLLQQRGVPFAERTVNTNEDIEALQRLSGNNNLPFGTIGGQQLSGYSEAEWTQYLDVANYPKKSALPVNYSRPAATPLVVLKRVQEKPSASVPRAAGSATATPRATPRGPTPSNPAGIQF